MTTNSPSAPLTPENCNLQDFPFMPLQVQLLRDSSFAVKTSGEEFRCGMLLICASWHQVPAASLPSDEEELAKLAGFGKDVRSWKKVSERALHGWIKCSDGRWYHRVVAEKALAAFKGKIAHRKDREAERLRKAAEREKKKDEQKKKDSGGPPDIPCVSGGQAGDVQQTGRKNPLETTPIGTEDSKEGIVERDSGSSSEPRAKKMDDDFVPTSPEVWLKFYKDEHGLGVDFESSNYKNKFPLLAKAWVDAQVCVGRMQAAIARAKVASSEPISFLPGYATSVLASQTDKEKPTNTGRHQGIENSDFRKGVTDDGRF